MPSADTIILWVLRATWASLPFTAGPTFAAAFAGSDSLLQRGGSVALWALWAVTLVALLVPLSQTLAVVRIVIPAALVAAIIAARAASTTEADFSAGMAAIAIGVSAVATVLVLTAAIGDIFINGNSYGDEWRAPLKPPGPVLFGPLPLAWLATVIGGTAGPWLLLSQRWIAGAVALVVGFAIAVVAVRAIYVLTQRWAVFVPAGMVVHDGFALAEPVLFRRREISSLHAAPSNPSSTDLTAGALGLALELQLDSPLEVARPVRKQPAEMQSIGGLLFSPTRPGKTLNTARERRLIRAS